MLWGRYSTARERFVSESLGPADTSGTNYQSREFSGRGTRLLVRTPSTPVGEDVAESISGVFNNDKEQGGASFLD